MAEIKGKPKLTATIGNTVVLYKDNPNTPATGSVERITYATLLADAWENEGDKYSQIVDVEGVTKDSGISIGISVDQLVAFHPKDLTFVAKNENGVVTVYAVGQKPQNDYVIQITVKEVIR